MANAASGMAVHDDCKLKFLELKAKRTYRFIVFKIEEKQKQVVVEKLGEPTESYENFTASLPADECRYAVYDFDFVTEENCQKSRIFFIAWSPDTSKVRSKMIYASSKDSFKRELDGLASLVIDGIWYPSQVIGDLYSLKDLEGSSVLPGVVPSFANHEPEASTSP
ncbi:hypothetical protein Nepgr_000080 [Nepenthes gracilis]|uniref:ADF-H domain-containing protein n=1 Tax=Nepenthes gracilis TaxID=150966 RepID=A0AAD3P2M4_NEPGR|nr:hypothetical protein Nepgr_000080 [Nepenthes gracilis]